jgi:hypothetical protein
LVRDRAINPNFSKSVSPSDNSSPAATPPYR